MILMMRVAILALLGAFTAAPAVAQDPAEKKPKSIALKKVSFKKGQVRPGYDLSAEPPLNAFQAKIGDTTLAFFDLNDDGVIEVDKDGLAIPPHPFVVPIPPLLLLSSGQYRVSFVGTAKIVVAQQILGAVEALVPDAALVTELRVRAGVRPAALNAKASADCEKHCDYLKANGLETGRGGMSAHDEVNGRSGYTAEGAAAGKGSDLGFQHETYRDALLGWYATAWHGAPMVNPALREFGAGLKHGVAMLYFSARGGTCDRVALHPPDGATHVLRSFGERGEIPNPVPGSDGGKGCGFPILLRLVDNGQDLTSAVVTDPAGQKVEGTFSCPAKPANTQWPTNSGCAVFIPSKPLAPKTTYKVRFEFGDEFVTWSFTTGK